MQVGMRGVLVRRSAEIGPGRAASAAAVRADVPVIRSLTELPALFGMANQGFNAGSTIRKAGTSCRLSLRKSPESQTRLLETTLLKPDYRAQIVVIGLTVVTLIRPERLQYSLAKKALVLFDHRADGGFVFHPD